MYPLQLSEHKFFQIFIPFHVIYNFSKIPYTDIAFIPSTGIYYQVVPVREQQLSILPLDGFDDIMTQTYKRNGLRIVDVLCRSFMWYSWKIRFCNYQINDFTVCSCSRAAKSFCSFNCNWKSRSYRFIIGLYSVRNQNAENFWRLILILW